MLQRWGGSAGKHFAWRREAKPPRRERLADEELRKREEKAASVPQAGEGKRTAVSKELHQKKEGSTRSEARLRKVLQRYCSAPTSPALCSICIKR